MWYNIWWWRERRGKSEATSPMAVFLNEEKDDFLAISITPVD